MRDLSAAIFSGTVCWMIQLVPQIWKSWREKSTEGLSPFIGYVVFSCRSQLIWRLHLTSIYRLLWAISGAFLGVYVIVQDLNVPLIVQPQVLLILCLISWSQVRFLHLYRIYDLDVDWMTVSVLQQ